MPCLCKGCREAGDFGGATGGAIGVTCQKGPFPDNSHKAQSPSQCQGCPMQTNRSKISPLFQFWRCWDTLLHSATLGGLHCDEARRPWGLRPVLRQTVLGEARPPCSAQTATVVPREEQ